MKFTFIDKENLCVYKDGSVQKLDSGYAVQYRERTQRENRNKEWKKNSDAMMYDGFFPENDSVSVSLTSISPALEDNKIIYSLSINETSGIYYKYTDDEKKTEAHFLSSNEENYQQITVFGNGTILGTVQKDSLTMDLAVFSPQGGDYKTVTGGDSLDENPFLGFNGEIWYNSYGIGRNLNNEFVQYMPSEILKLNTRTLDIETVLTSNRYSFVKPVLDSEGGLYCIRKPSEEKEKNNVFLDILLIPVRIVQAIIGFISLFVRIFTGKPLVKGKGKTANGGSAAKNADEQTIFIHNYMLNVDKELKRNEKNEESGFIPHTWQLVKIPKTAGGDTYDKETAEVLAKGVADFCIADNTLIYTNGKRIFAIDFENGEVKKRKLLNTDFCIKLGAVYSREKDNPTDFFDMI
ncbi:MAG: hypothetical protein E7371_01670 [Clostridiales bacterium]|nr:hypothetical protein [Clostridiales bacterium]